LNYIVEKIVNELEEKRLFGAKLVEYWISQNYALTNEQLVELVQFLSNKEYIFFWLELICYLLPSVFHSKHFVDIIDNIANKVRGDLAQGSFIDSLIEIGTLEPDLAIKTYEDIKKRYPHNLQYGALLLGGAGRVKADVIQTIIEEIPKKDGLECVALVRAIRVIFSESMSIDSNIFHMLSSLIVNKNDDVKREVSLAYFDFYNHDKEESFNQLKKLIQINNHHIKYTIANMLSMKDLDHKHFRGLISLLSEDTNNAILTLVARAIAIKNKGDTEYSLAIIKKCIDADKYFDINNLKWVLNEIGNANLLSSLNTVKKWFTPKSFRLFVYGSDILWALGEHNVETLTSFLLTWLGENHEIRFPLEGIRTILSKRYEIDHDQDDIVDLCYSALSEFAHLKGIEINRVTKQYNQKIFKCTVLIDELQKDKPIINYQVLLLNLERYKNIYQFFGQNWFKKKISESEKEHPIFILLSREFKQNSYHNSFLTYLDTNLQYFNLTESRIGSIRRGLRSAVSFWYTISEVDVIAKLRQMYKVQIEPIVEREHDGKIIKSRPDLMVTINSNDLLIEVISPDMYAPLKFFHSAGIPDRLRSKIYTEFQEHFQGKIFEFDVVIFVDISDSEIDYYSAENYLKGSYQFTMRLDKATRKVIATFPSRAKDAMHLLDPETKSIIGLILYKRITGSDGKIHLKGRVFPNEFVMNDVRRHILYEIKESFFG